MSTAERERANLFACAFVLCSSIVRSYGREFQLSDSWGGLSCLSLSPLHRHARRRPPQFAAPFHLDEEHSTDCGGGWVFLDLDEIVLLQIQLQDRVFDGGKDEANVLRVWKRERRLLLCSILIYFKGTKIKFLRIPNRLNLCSKLSLLRYSPVAHVKCE